MLDSTHDQEKAKTFMRMEKWVFDSPDQAGEAFRQFAIDIFQKNKLIKGGLKIGEEAVDLKNLTIPVLNILAEQDHLVPPDSSKALRTIIGSKDYKELCFPGGHIGIYVSGKSQKQITPAIAEWLRSHNDE